MSAGKNKNKNKKAQLDLFAANQATSPIPPTSPPQAVAKREEASSKVVSMAEFKHQQSIKKFYEVASQATSHLKK